MENEKDRDAIVTMCLTGYRDTIKKLTYALITIAVCWLCTVGGSYGTCRGTKCKLAAMVLLKIVK